MSKPIFGVVQEGGSSQEHYLHTFNTERQAEKYRKGAAKSAYRTSVPFQLSVEQETAARLLDDGELFDLARTLANAADEVDYP